MFVWRGERVRCMAGTAVLVFCRCEMEVGGGDLDIMVQRLYINERDDETTDSSHNVF